MLDHGSGELIAHVSASKRRADFIALLETPDLRHGPKHGRAAAPVMSAQTVGFALALDHGPIHAGGLTRAAIAK